MAKIASKNLTDSKFCKGITLMLLGQIATCLSRQICNNQLQKKFNKNKNQWPKQEGSTKFLAYFFSTFFGGQNSIFIFYQYSISLVSPAAPRHIPCQNLVWFGQRTQLGSNPGPFPARVCQKLEEQFKGTVARELFLN